MENDNSNKSIIYGNVFQNNYAKFMPICSSIMDRSSIDNILEYLRETPHFKKYNRIAYAYRVDQMPVVFITEKKNVDTHYYEGSHSDETIEGSGQKLLHLLEKFNIRNVLVVVLIQQFNPLMPFQCTNYRAIVENSRILLNELYKKVILFQQQQKQDKFVNDLLLNQQKVLKMNKVDIAEDIKIPTTKNSLPKQRPNYVYGIPSKPKPAFATKKLKKPNVANHQQMQFLWERCRSLKDQYASLLDTLHDKQLQEMRYFVMYDKNQAVNTVIQMFMIFESVTKQQIMEEFDFKSFKKKQLQILPMDRFKKLDQILKTNKKLNMDTVIKINRALGMIFSLMEISIRYSNCMQRITSLVNKNEKKNSLGISMSGGTSAIKIDALLS